MQLVNTMICAVWLAVVLSFAYIWLLYKQIQFVRSARETADRPIPENFGGTVILVLSYLSIFSLALNILVVLFAQRRLAVVVTH